MFTITLKKNRKFQKKYKVSSSIEKIINDFSSDLLKNCVAVKINDKLLDTKEIIKNDAEIELITTKDKESINIIRETCAHILGYSTKKIFPEAKMIFFSITNNGFYYDIDFNRPLKPKDLEIIEKKMCNIIKKNLIIQNKLVSKINAKKIFQLMNEKYKLELLDKFKEKKFIKIYFYKDYPEISLGPCAPSTKFCKNFKLEKFSKIQNSNKKNLQRIYGTVWNKKKELIKYFNEVEEKKKKDHRKISKKLDLYHFQKESPNMIFWHENGLIIFNELKKMIREKYIQFNYQEVKSPLILNYDLWKKTGHWDNYKINMFSLKYKNKVFCIKPMSCPGHIQIFKQKNRSYKDLPLRIAEFGSCYRNEPSGSSHGLMRIQEFTQDDGHIFCKEDQICSEIKNCINMIYDVYKIFNFKKIKINLSTRPDKRIGNDSQWNFAENELIKSLEGRKYLCKEKEGAFYGPKIDFVLYDNFNRPWQCGTIQLDFLLPSYLDAFYIDKNNNKKNPILIHRAILGSIERFIGILIEHFSGFFPIWLSPIQVAIINITEEQIDFANNIANNLLKLGVRIKKDFRNERINRKIRENIIQRIPYIVICGEKEIKNNELSVRINYLKEIKIFKISEFFKKITKEIKNKKYFIK